MLRKEMLDDGVRPAKGVRRRRVSVGAAVALLATGIRTSVSFFRAVRKEAFDDWGDGDLREHDAGWSRASSVLVATPSRRQTPKRE